MVDSTWRTTGGSCGGGLKVVGEEKRREREGWVYIALRIEGDLDKLRLTLTVWGSTASRSALDFNWMAGQCSRPRSATADVSLDLRLRSQKFGQCSPRVSRKACQLYWNGSQLIVLITGPASRMLG